MKKYAFFFLLILAFLKPICLPGQTHSLIPEPAKAKWGKSKFLLEGARVVISPELLSAEQSSVSNFIDFVKQSTGITLTIAYHEEPEARSIVLKSDMTGEAVPVPGEK